jgi:hypothetical protein
MPPETRTCCNPMFKRTTQEQRADRWLTAFVMILEAVCRSGSMHGVSCAEQCGFIDMINWRRTAEIYAGHNQEYRDRKIVHGRREVFYCTVVKDLGSF